MRKRKRKKFWSIWRLIVVMSFCLNVFGLRSFIVKTATGIPAVRRHFAGVVVDGYWYRVCNYFK